MIFRFNTPEHSPTQISALVNVVGDVGVEVLFLNAICWKAMLCNTERDRLCSQQGEVFSQGIVLDGFLQSPDSGPAVI